MSSKEHRPSSGKLGVIAGSGDLPERIIHACRESGQEVFAIAFEGETDAASITKVPHAWVRVGEVGKAIHILRQEQVSEVILVGKVQRPALSTLKLDFTGMKLLARIMRTRMYGDNAIFSTIIQFLEDQHFNVVGVDAVLSQLLAPAGVMGRIQPRPEDYETIGLAVKVAKAIGQLDIGQAVIVQQGMVLGVEAVEGTDGLIERCAKLQREGRGGILVKMKKPKQEARIDLPTIGVLTVENASKAGLVGIAIEAGGALIIDLDAVIAKAEALGLFLVGIYQDQQGA